ncbi:hypothetical protein T02_14810 [Trichinella nativa]|uniref:Uncharacterized protein n=1 Tax=Trichinella nativa TaxID=6335 RepID=A0A0V1LQ32_9BILA|nr:hypothetical protein T02_14810 [Trichinella nativa]
MHAGLAHGRHFHFLHSAISQHPPIWSTSKLCDVTSETSESDVFHCLISDPGNKFCAVDKPYHKSQTKEAAVAVCIDDATIFGHFNLIGQNVENCA